MPVPFNILLVDDSTVVHKVLTFRLKLLEWTVVSAHGGRQAIQLFDSTKFNGIDMVLMDMCMPGMDGRTTTKMLIDRGCTTPIIVLTATPDNVIVHGAMGVLGKPLQIPSLVHALLRAHRKNLLANVVHQ